MDETHQFSRRPGSRRNSLLQLAFDLACIGAMLSLAIIPVLTTTGCQHATASAAIQTGTTAATKIAAAVSTTAQKVVNENTALPASLKQRLATFIAAHPEFQSLLMSAANGIESLATDASVAVSDTQLLNGVLPWLEQIPGYGTFFAGLQVILQGADASVQLTAPALVEFGELIKSYA